MAKLLPCPFCGATPHQGQTKVRYCQMHGEPMQDWFIACPKQHARMEAADQERATAMWNQRTEATVGAERE